MLVIDKNSSRSGAIAIDEWEQWFSNEFFINMAQKLGCRLETHENLPYENGLRDGLFNGWVLYKD